MQPRTFWRYLAQERKAPGIDKAESVLRSFSITEKAIFAALAAIFAVSALLLVAKVSASFTVGVPERGGELIEGIAGTPRFINPLLAISDADRDLTALVYSGLLKATPAGTFVPDLAEEFTVSPDGLVYSFTIKEGAKFHDDTPVTAEDVKFTVEKAKDSALKSPRRVNWEGVAVETEGARNVTFTLKQPYAPFVSNLAMGIMPKHLWENLSADQMPFSSLNIDPVGSGPYRISAVERSRDGIPHSITLRANRDYALGEPYITTLRFAFYGSEKSLVEALSNGSVESASNLSPASAKAIEGKAEILSAPLTRVFGIFFNQNENELLAHKEVRKALAESVDKASIVEDVLLGFGTVADGPLPPTIAKEAAASAASTSTPGLSAFLKAGWKKSPEGVYEQKGKAKGAASTTLSLSLATANVPDLVESARVIEEDWKSFGAKVDVRVFEPSDLNQGVIRPRKYDALLFGIVIGKNSDLYPFWHSSQRNDPGLNIAMYTNAKADRYLERMRQATSTDARQSLYSDFKKEVDADTPAIFLWSPDFIYAAPKKLRGVELGEITVSSDRFAGIEDWYIESDRVWHAFAEGRDRIEEK
ncbi:MAG: peptide ABC transporter substrate-binding protein [Candidatus Taylorbacteria bacterium]|nr:peptide ABC transporter substrate-binding protein [Candidatus Taylorbacteria bacterium]